MAFQNALKQFVSTVDPEYTKGYVEFFIGFEGSFGNKHVTPRTLTSRFLSNLVCVEGIVTKCNYIIIIKAFYIIKIPSWPVLMYNFFFFYQQVLW